MNTWIFQANPAKFDIDGYLAALPGEISWEVNQHAKQVGVGDHVYLWRGVGDEPDRAGVVADGEVTSQVLVRPDDENALPFWYDKNEGTTARPRVWLRVNRVATAKTMLRRSWLLEDPILRDVSILKMPRGTNFSVDPSLVGRLATMWAKVGTDWTRGESIAGLWAYAKTLGGPISRLPGSPVAKVSILTGRVVSGVYNKVMNFRSLDPTDERKGMPDSGAMDQVVWDEFFNKQENRLDLGAVQAEFDRLWTTTPGEMPELSAADTALNAEVKKLSERSLEDLWKAYRRGVQRGARQQKPAARMAAARAFDRNPLVIAIAKKRANNRCEVLGCAIPVFVGDDGIDYCEIHHINMLAKGGEDTPENAVCLCPHHHREVHYGKNSDELTQKLRALRAARANPQVQQ